MDGIGWIIDVFILGQMFQQGTNAMSGTHGVQLTAEFQTYYQVNVIDGFRIRITATAAQDMVTKIFRYRNIPVQPGQAAAVGVFDGICSPADIEEFPENAPYDNADPPWYRLDTVDLVFRTREEAEDAWASIQIDVQGLVDSLDAMAILEALEPVWIGDSGGAG